MAVAQEKRNSPYRFDAASHGTLIFSRKSSMKIVQSRALRKLGAAAGPNDGHRSLVDSILLLEVVEALKDWVTEGDPNAILIGGVAFSYYAKPRLTQDLDFLSFYSEDIPASVPGFKQIRNHAYQHDRTHVEIEVLTPSFLRISEQLAERVQATANLVEGVKIASPEGLVALKLGRFSRRDQADIEELMRLPAFQWDESWDALLSETDKQRLGEIKDSL